MAEAMEASAREWEGNRALLNALNRLYYERYIRTPHGADDDVPSFQIPALPSDTK